MKLSKAQESRLEKQRLNDDQRDTLLKYLKDDQLASLSNNFLDRSDSFRRKREADERATEKSQMEALKKKERLKKAIELSSDENMWIAKTVEDHDTKFDREQRVLQQLIKGSSELKSLKTKLQVAEMNRQRHQQMQEKQVLELEEASRNAAYHKLMEKQLAEAQKKESAKTYHQQLLKVEAKMKLEEQLLEKEALRQLEREENQQVHEEMDKVIFIWEALACQIVSAECCFKSIDLMNICYLRDFSSLHSGKQARAREYIAEYSQHHAKMKNRMEIEERQKEEEILRYQAKVEQRLAEKEVKDNEKREQNEKIHAKLSAGKEEEARQKEQLETVLNDLYFEEAEARYIQYSEQHQLQREHMKENLKAASHIHQHMKEHQKLQEKAEKEEFHRKMMQQLAEENRLEQMSAQRRRIKIEQFKDEIEKLWIAKKAAFEEQIEESSRRRRKEEELNARKEALIEEERCRLLAEHGKRLAKFLPKGTLQQPEDLKIVGLRR
ncbi:hypothetical protein O6H91_10G092300 [Diphasiastrum complanatum]|uniref:Uncharacterized protein n=1 Tax=Diphasiastrum complanatum TaxID=34168 RepID=A0ACC2CJN8_DIPCM|nr:hypothetical protein O6H91_10G092300 [Diphasiastrum complanatum]